MNPEQIAHIALCRSQMQYAHARMAVTFSAVPEARLDWSPSPTAKSAIRIVSHCVDAYRSISKVLRGDANEASPDWDFCLESKEQALAELAASRTEFEEALDTMTPGRYSESAMSPGGPVLISKWVQFVGWHLAEHAGQIDFLQTCWDDQESRYPEE